MDIHNLVYVGMDDLDLPGLVQLAQSERFVEIVIDHILVVEKISELIFLQHYYIDLDVVVSQIKETNVEMVIMPTNSSCFLKVILIH